MWHREMLGQQRRNPARKDSKGESQVKFLLVFFFLSSVEEIQSGEQILRECKESVVGG